MDNIIDFNNNGTTVTYWYVETEVQTDLSEFLNENEIEASRHEVRNKVVYILKNREDYLTLSSLNAILS